MPASDRIRELEHTLDLAVRVKDTWMVRYIAAHELLCEVAAGDIPSPDWYERANALVYPRTAAMEEKP